MKVLFQIKFESVDAGKGLSASNIDKSKGSKKVQKVGVEETEIETALSRQGG